MSTVFDQLQQERQHQQRRHHHPQPAAPDTSSSSAASRFTPSPLHNNIGVTASSSFPSFNPTSYYSPYTAQPDPSRENNSNFAFSFNNSSSQQHIGSTTLLDPQGQPIASSFAPPTSSLSPAFSSSPLQQLQQHPYQPPGALSTDRPIYPWVHSSASSITSIAPPSTTGQSYSDRRKLIHSFQSSVNTVSSRPQSAIIMESTYKHQPLATRSSSPARRSLSSLSDRGKSRSATELNKTAKKSFWGSFPRRFRPKDAVRPAKSDSFGNKKAKFSNERTLVHWIKAAMLLGSLSMTLLSFGENQVTPYIGATLLVICLMTLIYAVTTFQVRMEWLNMRRDDVIYYDRLAPSLITALVMGTFLFNAIAAYTGDFTTNKDYLKKKAQ
ncbi:hypothetical protein BGZ83_010438 [Gryganskiella cystojenkinii]|nr:hypothetical protein BGZ83_010438 [Gryganskiella cystojenkinii]